jgi:D-alanyl-D-alanine carboxypeptidase
MEKRIRNHSLFSPPQITAKSWAVLNANTGELLGGQHEHERREIASITKVMTAYTAIQIINSLNINVDESKVETSYDASLMIGTTAYLEEGDVLSVRDMLHAMLLPSGNDAAYALAEYFGLVLIELGLKASKLVDPIQVFLCEMNKNAKAIRMSNTNYANPHGLQNFFNKSSALDIAKLSQIVMRFSLFSEIVKKQKYSCTGQDLFGNNKTFTWKNTNKLLAKGFNGLKTGITSSAGPCLVSNYKDDMVNLIIVVLSSKTPDHRWTETMKLKDWIVRVLTKMKEKSESVKVKKVVGYDSKKRGKVF